MNLFIGKMELCQKICLLNELAEPFGYSYLPDQDIMTSRIDAWQREFGYCSLYDRSAVHFNMVLDCEPIYFDHQDRTWLIELWKGQYGINTGSEIGIYQAGRILYLYSLLPFAFRHMLRIKRYRKRDFRRNSK